MNRLQDGEPIGWSERGGNAGNDSRCKYEPYRLVQNITRLFNPQSDER